MLLSLSLRLLCIWNLVYVVLVMVHETDSYLPLAVLVFCVGILFESFYLIKKRKEHLG